MPTIIEMNVNTGKQTEREMTSEEISAIPESSNVIPDVITALQGLLALDQSGLSSFYESWANNPARTFSQKAFINKALTWKRSDPTLNEAANDIGITPAQVDSLFELAATL